MTVLASRPASDRLRRLHARRRSLLFSCALGTSLVLASQSERANAQATNATPSTVAGSVTYSRNTAPTPGSETVFVDSPTAIINWQPPADLPAGPYVFLPQGNSLTFENGFLVSNFAVLNRILTDRPSRFDGSVISRLNDGNSVFSPGGTVLFSSPGGIIVGSTALFDVGNLVLTTLDVVDVEGNFVSPNGGFQFELNGGGANPNASILTEAGSRIFATSENSFVALVAPQVNLAGQVAVNGSVGYIAGEQVSFSVNDGLFDIQVTVGSDNPFPIVHAATASTGGPSSTGAGDNHGVYMVAVAKNQAITMLLEGTVGFEAATDVTVDNGVIVLSAGYNVSGGETTDVAGDTLQTASIDIDGGTYTSDLIGRATGNAVATAAANAVLDFDGSVELQAADRAELVAEAGSTITVGGDLALLADDLATGNAGEARLEARSGSTVNVTGNVTLSADSGFPGLDSFPPDAGADAQGGTSAILAQGGTIGISGNVDLSATAIAERGLVTGGAGTGGTASIEAQDGGTLTVAGSALLETNGTGGGSSGVSGTGIGGTSEIRATGTGSVGVTGSVELYAYGFGGGSFLDGSDAGGLGDGGSALVEVASGGTLTLGSTFVDASGFGGIGDNGGDGLGGLAAIRGDGTIVTTGSAGVFAEGVGRFGIGLDGTTGGDGTGGEALIQANAGSTFTFGGDVDIFADGRGSFGGNGGNGTGGLAEMSATGAQIDVAGELLIVASGFGGGESGYGAFLPGTGTGGTARLQAVAQDGVGADIDVTDGATLLADGGTGTIFENGGAPCPPSGCSISSLPPPDFLFDIGPAGPGQGGRAEVIVRDSRLATLDLVVAARGIGGPGADAFSGVATGGFAGVGGDVLVEFSSADVTLDALFMDARGGGGIGGSGAPAGNGGDGTGGSATLQVSGTEPVIGEFEIGAGGFAGPGGAGPAGANATGGNGGIGRGGEILVDVGAGGLLTLDVFNFDARGQGGAGGAGSSGLGTGGQGGEGGDGFGGTLELRTSGGEILVANTDGISLDTPGFGGQGGTGGATSGDAEPGGPGGNGGNGTGGTTLLNVVGGTITSPVTQLASTGFGGAGGAAGDNPFLIGTPGVAGNGSGGLSRIAVADGNGVSGNASLGFASLSSSGIGGDGFTTFGDVAGRIQIEDNGTVESGLGFAELTATTGGAASTEGPAFAFTSTAGPVAVAGDVNISVDGDVSFAATGTGSLVAGGAVNVFTGGGIQLSHDARAAGTATVSGGSIEFFAFGDLTGSPGTLLASTAADVLISANSVDLDAVVSARDLSVDTGSSASFAALAATPGSIVIQSATAARDIDLDAIADIHVGFAQAGDDFTAFAGGAFTGGTVVATGAGEDTEVDSSSTLVGSNIDVFTFGDLRLDNGDAAGDITLVSVGGSVLSDVLLDAGGDLSLTAGADTGATVDITIADANAGGLMDLDATGSLTANALTAGGDITANLGGNATVSSIATGGSLALFAPGAVDLGTVVAANDVVVDPTTIVIDSVTAGGDIDLDATGDISVGFAQAGDDFTASAGGIFTGGTVVVTGLGPDSEFGYGTLGGSNIVIDANGDLRLDTGTAPDTIDLTSLSGNILSNGTLTATDLLANAALDIALNDVFVTSALFLSTPNGSISGNSFNSDGDISLSGTGGVTLAAADSGGSILIDADGAVDLGALVAADNLDVAASSIVLASGIAGTDVILSATGAIAVGFAQAGDDFTASAGGAFTGGTIVTTGLGPDFDESFFLIGSNIVVDASADLRLDNGDAADDIRLTSSGGNIFSNGLLAAGSDLIADAALDLDIADADAGSLIGLFAGDDVDAAALTAGSSIATSAGGDTIIASATSGGTIDIAAVDLVDLGTVVAAGDVIVDPVTIAIDSVTAGGDIILDATADITVGFAQAGDDFVANAGTTFNGTTVIATGLGTDSEQGFGPLAGGNIEVNATGDLRLDNGDAAADIRLASRGGSILSSTLLFADSDVFATAALNIDIDDAEAGGFIDLSAGGFVDAASLTAGDSIFSSSGGATTIVTGDAADTIFVSAGGAADLGTFAAGNFFSVDAASIDLASGTAGIDVSLTATGDILVTFAEAGDDFTASAGGIFTGDTVIVTGLGPDTEAGYGSLEGSNIVIDASGNLRLDNGTAPDTIDLTSFNGSIFSDGTLTAETLLADAATDLLLNDVFVVSDLILTTLNGDIAGNSFNSDGAVTLDASADVTLAQAVSGASIDVSAGGAADLGTFVAAVDITVDAASIDIASATAGRFIDLVSGNSLAAVALSAGDSIFTASGGNTAIGTADAAGSIFTSSGGDTTIATADAGNGIFVSAVGGAGLGMLTAGNDLFVDAASIALANGTAGIDISLSSAGDILVTFALAGDDFTASAGGIFTGDTVIVTGLGPDTEAGYGSLDGSNIAIDSAGNLRLDNGTAPGRIELTSFNGSILSDGTLTANLLLADAAADLLLNDVFVDAGLDLTTFAGSIAGNSFNSGGAINLRASETVTLAAADSGGSILVDVGGAADFGTLVAASSIFVNAAAIDLVSATAATDMLLNASGDIRLGLAQSGDDFLASAGGIFTGGTVIVTGLAPDSEAGSGNFGGSNILVTAGADLTLDDGSAPNSIALLSSAGAIFSGGTLAADRLLAAAGLDIGLNDVFVVTDLTLLADAGSIAGNSFNSESGSILVSAGGAATIDAAGAAGSIIVLAEGAAGLGTLTAGDDIQVSAASIDLASGTAGTDVTLLASGDIRLGSAQAGDDFVATAGGIFTADAVIATGLGPDSEAGYGAFEGGNILVEAGGDLRLDNGAASEDIFLSSSAGSVLSGVGGSDALGSLSAGGDILATAALDTFLGNATAGGAFAADAGRNGAFANVSADDVSISALGSAAFSGAVRAPTIEIISADIDVAGTASLGDSGTELVSLVALATGQQTVLGGTAEGPGYTLTNAEAARIAADLLRIETPQNGTGANRAADVLVRELSLSGQAVGRFALVNSGIVQVEGGLLLSNAQPTGGIEIEAGERLQIVTPSGSIRVRDASGLTAGTLDITSNNVWAAGQALLDQLRANPDFAGRDAALAANNGSPEPRGFIEAGDVTLSVGETLFVQNSGNLLGFAGITVRENTLRIVPTGTQPLRVFAFGRRINPDGSFVTNNGFFAEVVFEGRGGPVGYTDESQFNLCFINSGACRLPSPDDPLPGGPEIIEEPVDGSDVVGLSPTISNELVDTSFADEPLIEEPVTSGADSILWDCDTDDDGDCDEEDTNG